MQGLQTPPGKILIHLLKANIQLWETTNNSGEENGKTQQIKHAYIHAITLADNVSIIKLPTLGIIAARAM